MCQFCLKMSEPRLWYVAALLQTTHLERPHLEAPNLQIKSLKFVGVVYHNESMYEDVLDLLRSGSSSAAAPWTPLHVCIHIYIYIYVYTTICIYIYIQSISLSLSIYLSLSLYIYIYIYIHPQRTR